MTSWKYVASRGQGFGSSFGQIPTEFGLARISVARHVPARLAPLIEQTPAMVILLRKIARGKVVCRPDGSCNCMPCEAIRILAIIDGVKETEIHAPYEAT